jgi:deferrochelatase/peroxidase EfeB
VAASGLLGTDDAAGRRSGDPLQADGPLQLGSRGDPSARIGPVPFHGAHQAGIVSRPPPAACFASFDLVARDRRELAGLLRRLTGRARLLTAGGAQQARGGDRPPPDSGTLGPVVPADGLTITVGVGSSLFDHRYGLSDRRPLHLTKMRTFPNDDLDPAQTGGDLLLQICAGSADTAIHALRDIAGHSRDGMRIRWRLDGFVAPPRPTGVPRNHFAFKDGIANPDIADAEVAERLLWVNDDIGEPAWAVAGTYHVCRIIKMRIEFWDRVSLDGQQRIIGRHRDTGAPLDGHRESDIPDYGADPRGRRIPLDAHIRLANPRTAGTELSRIYRRGYNYDRGIDGSGNLDMGLIFNCFQQDVVRQFEATQRRLAREPLARYVTPVGGGYFFTLPGVRDEADWFGRRLLDA